jgi:hypothetical protein
MAAAHTPLGAQTTADLWAHARDLTQRGAQELSPVLLRRALVTLAIAGSGDDPAGYRAAAAGVRDAFRRLAVDPVPLFDAASALVHEDDAPARETLVTLPR